MDGIDDNLIIENLLWLAGLLVYLFPIYLAFRWRHRQRYWLAAVVLLLGWTGLAWLVSLAWAMHGRPGAEQRQAETDHDPDVHLAFPRDVHDSIEDMRDDC